jgi:hypothetical protein
VERLALVLQRVLTVLIPCWCLVPVVVVTGFCFWAMIEAPWVWKPLFVAGLLTITATATTWGVRLGEQIRRDRETTARTG